MEIWESDSRSAKMHPNFKEKDVSFFKRKEESLKKQWLDASGAFLKQNNGIIKASYEVSLLIAKEKKTSYDR